ncbi:c-type cytochrome [Chryseolinea soli]|uniref:Cytochrome c n=1 Tax=Chryseolinea soli TaxID=2321403 RepID=A0A385SKE3_9BACT|nr:cytochrome c [Chryseolinea soli]AYB30395.1 cytochrome c [Chryseolinea soli]
MSRIINGVVVAISLCLAWSCAKKEAAEGQSSPVASDTSVRQGVTTEGSQALYESKCSVCHGSDGTAGIAGAANLQLTSLDTVALRTIIADGKNAMPSFKTSLSKTEIHELVGYIKTLKK